MSISSTLIDGADIRFREAAGALSPFVGCFWTLTAGAGATVRVVPDASATISIEVEERPAQWFLRGPLSRPHERRFASAATVVGIRLRPGVAYLLSGIPAHALLDERVDAREVPSLAALAEIRPRPRTADEHITALERFLLDRLTHAAVHGTVAAAIRAIERAHGCVPVGAVAAACDVSPRHLNRLMRAWAGYTTKRFATIIRFQSTLHRMEQVPKRSGASLAAESGYFDQAHLTVNVARFAGATPGRLSTRAVADFSKTRCDDLP